MKIANYSCLKLYCEEHPCVNDAYTYAERKRRESNDTFKSVTKEPICEPYNMLIYHYSFLPF